MLFKREFHQRIVCGEITTTFRAWKSARVKVGNTYRLNSEGVVEVEAVHHIPVSKVGEDDALASGFESRDALIGQLSRSGLLAEDSSVFRVEFHYLPSAKDPFADVSDEVPHEEVVGLVTRLQTMDRRSRSGPWTAQTLSLIEANPKVASSQLAPTLDMETPVFKTNVRKLKGMGLTISYGTGYGLTSLGNRVLRSISVQGD